MIYGLSIFGKGHIPIMWLKDKNSHSRCYRWNFKFLFRIPSCENTWKHIETHPIQRLIFSHNHDLFFVNHASGWKYWPGWWPDHIGPHTVYATVGQHVVCISGPPWCLCSLADPIVTARLTQCFYSQPTSAGPIVMGKCTIRFSVLYEKGDWRGCILQYLMDGS